jgi:hypothetical protein
MRSPPYIQTEPGEPHRLGTGIIPAKSHTAQPCTIVQEPLLNLYYRAQVPQGVGEQLITLSQHTLTTPFSAKPTQMCLIPVPVSLGKQCSGMRTLPGFN